MSKNEQIRLHDELTKRLRAAQAQTNPPMSSGQLDILERVMRTAPAPHDIDLDTTKSQVTFYKDERHVTMYSFEALQLAGDLAWNTLLDKAFGGRFLAGRSPDSLGYEGNLPEPVAMRDWLLERYQNKQNPHPHLGTNVRANEKIAKAKTLVPFEGSTQVDVRAIWGEGPRSTRLYGEAKFLSDISGSVSYWPVRNQIARNVEAGLTDCMHALYPDVKKAELEIEPASIDNFWFLLITPALFRDVEPESRLYGYKMRAYMSDPQSLRRDLAHLSHLTDAHWTQISAQMAWITWEEIRTALEQAKSLSSSLQADLDTFYDQRQIV